MGYKQFVQLVEKYNNGKIRKNQSLSLDEFVNQITPTLNNFVFEVPQLSFWDRMTGNWKKKLDEEVIEQKKRMQNSTKTLIKRDIQFMIEIDVVGKSKK